MDSMKNHTLEKLLKNDLEYQRIIAEINQAYELYEQLKLAEEQRKVIDTLIARENEKEYDIKVNAYMAGLPDGYEILKMFNLTRE